MTKRWFLLFFLLYSGFGNWSVAQESEPHIRVFVNLVQLHVAVTDSKGNYVTGLPPQAFSVTEDGIPQTISTYAEGNEVTRTLVANALPPKPQGDSTSSPPALSQTASGDPSQKLGSLVAGANVF